MSKNGLKKTQIYKNKFQFFMKIFKKMKMKIKLLMNNN